MKRYYYLFTVILLSLFISACEDEDNPVDGGGARGSIYIQTTNATDAQIWVDNTNTGKTTPDSVTNLTVGNHTVTLKLAEYRDTTFTVSVSAGLQTSRAIALSSSLAFTTYVDTLWETTGTTAAQPSGLDLSTGVAVSTGNAAHDIFYSSTGFVIRTSTARGASFFVGTGTDLADGVNSPLATGAWVTSVSDLEDNYFYIFDADLHYSKMKILSRGGGNPGFPAWVIVEWRYNTNVNDILF